MKAKLKKFASWMSGLKDRDDTLIFLIGLDLMLAIASNVVDWPWLMSVDWYLRPFAPICSLFPLTLAIWFIIYLKNRRVPAWYTTFIFVGLISYGIIAQLYYPVYMSHLGFHWRLPGNMLWVALYASQALIIASEIRPAKTYQFALVVAYYLFKDYSDRYLGTFIDDAQKMGFPEAWKDFFFILIIILHVGSFALVMRIAFRHYRQLGRPQPAPEPLPPKEDRLLR